MMKSWYRRAVLVYWQVGTRNGTLRLVPPRLHLPATLWNSSAASLSEHEPQAYDGFIRARLFPNIPHVGPLASTSEGSGNSSSCYGLKMRLICLFCGWEGGLRLKVVVGTQFSHTMKSGKNNNLKLNK